MLSEDNQKRNWNVHWTVPENETSSSSQYVNLLEDKNLPWILGRLHGAGLFFEADVYTTFWEQPRSFWGYKSHRQSLAIAHLVEWLQTVTAAQSKSTRSRKQKLSTIESHHQMDGWSPHSRLCTHPEISLVRFCADFTKILRMRL